MLFDIIYDDKSLFDLDVNNAIFGRAITIKIQ